MSVQDVLSRRSLMMLGLGKSGPVKDDGGVQLMQALVTSAETRDNTPVVQNFGFSSVPPTGSDIFLAFQGGDRARGMVIGTNHPGSRPRNLSPGQSVQYDSGGSLLKLTNDGNGVLTLSSASGTFALTGNLTVSGSIVSQGDMIAGPTKISLINHQNTLVTIGESLSGPPAPG